MEQFEEIHPNGQPMGQFYPARGITYTNDTFEVSNALVLIRGDIVTDNNRIIYVANNGGFAGRRFILHDPVSVLAAGIKKRKRRQTKKTRQTKKKKTRRNMSPIMKIQKIEKI
jgi:hypothetical protein